MPVLAGVVALGIGLLYTAVNLTDSDWVAVFGGMAVLVSCVAVLDYAGRREARLRPDARYEASHLPGHKNPLKRVLMILTFVALVAWEFATAQPDTQGYSSPFPYLLAAGFVFFVSPQLTAHLAMRRPGPSPA